MLILGSLNLGTCFFHKVNTCYFLLTMLSFSLHILLRESCKMSTVISSSALTTFSRILLFSSCFNCYSFEVVVMVSVNFAIVIVVEDV